MNCPQCGYQMTALDTVCPRCQGKGSGQVTPSSPVSAAPHTFLNLGQDDQWFYAQHGQNYGPVTSAQMEAWIAQGQLHPDTPVWRGGMMGWAPARFSSLAPLFGLPAALPSHSPAYRHPQHVNNGLAWFLAFSPLWASLLLGAITSITRTNGLDFWWVIASINLIVVFGDTQQMKAASHKGGDLMVWGIFLVPAYLFLRAKRLNQSNAYGWVWCGLLLILVLFMLLLSARNGASA